MIERSTFWLFCIVISFNIKLFRYIIGYYLNNFRIGLKFFIYHDNKGVTMALEESEAIKAYIGTEKTLAFYEEAFKKYSVAGVDQFAWHWSWWAFGGGMFYLLYRKLYLEALGYFILFMVVGAFPLISIVLWIISGGVLPYFVYKRYKKIKAQVETNLSDSQEQLSALRELGGVNKWAIWVAVIFTLLFWGGGLYMAILMSAVPN
jgi:hypothetical protein